MERKLSPVVRRHHLEEPREVVGAMPAPGLEPEDCPPRAAFGAQPPTARTIKPSWPPLSLPSRECSVRSAGRAPSVSRRTDSRGFVRMSGLADEHHNLGEVRAVRVYRWGVRVLVADCESAE